ncbi:MAG: response regulator transcription factor [Verrucomicrobia bacterium]|nr:response regulator transcription factor [Verrucomicrobiota bacterium]
MLTTNPSRTEPKPLIIIVEDEAELAALISVHLEKAGMHTQICSRAAHALKFLKKNFANLLLLDITLPDQSGFSLMEEIKAAGITKISDEPFDFCGAMITPERLEIAFPSGAALKLGRKELGILAYLNANQGHVITRQALIHAVWGVHADVRSRSLDQYVVKVRDLYSEHGLDLSAFRTVHGIGYIFDPKGVSKEGR